MNKAKLQCENVAINRKSIRSAMKVYSNLEKLGQHPLASLMIVGNRRKKAAYSETVNGFGLALQDLLSEALESLKPSDKEPKILGDEWHPYKVLSETYVVGKDRIYLAREEFHIEPRTYHRWLNDALQMLSDKLNAWEQEARAIQSARYQLAAIPDRPRNHEIVGRDDLISSIKTQLLKGGKHVSIALQGGPGVGKTAIAVEMAHDLEVKNYFQGGILWAGLEEKSRWTKKRKTAEILVHLSRWGEVLGISAERMAKAAEIENRKKLLDQEIGSGRWFIIIDNVWDLDLAKGLQLIAPNCANLITTRNPQVAHKFAPHNSTPVSELSVADGQKLIAQLAPEAQNIYPQKVEEIVQAVGGLPLSLILIGNFLRAVSLSGQPRHLEEAFRQLSLPENRLILSGEDVSVERPAGFPEDLPVSLAASIQFSEKMLDERSKEVLKAISLLPPKPNTFPEEAALAVSGLDTPEPIDKLYHRGLLDNSGRGRYAMHPTINDFARQGTTNRAAYTRMVDYYGRFIEDNKSDFLILDSETKNILAAVDIAHTRRKRSALVKGVNSLFGYLNTRGMYPTAKIHFERALKSAEALKDNERIVTTRLNLGQIAMKLGEYNHAKDCFETGLALARRLKDRKNVCAMLNGIGDAHEKLGEIDVAEKCLKEGLRNARQLDDRFRIGSILVSLGGIENNRGNYKQSQVFLLEGLNVARELNDHDLASSLLSNLGVLNGRQGQLAKAKEYFQESLSHARNTGNREQICLLHLNLGAAEGRQGNNAKAMEYFSEALRIASEIGDPEKICSANISLGVQADKRGDYDKAEQYFLEALRLAREIGHLNRISNVLFNLGGVEINRGNYTSAKKYLTESMKIARKLNMSQRVGFILMNLGGISIEQRNFAGAYKYLKEALSLAQKNNDQETECDILIEFGNLYIAKGKLDQAESILEQALEIARQTGARDLEAQALFRLSKIDKIQGNDKKAIQLARKSLQMFESMKHRLAAEVRKYLRDELGVD